MKMYVRSLKNLYAFKIQRHARQRVDAAQGKANAEPPGVAANATGGALAGTNAPPSVAQRHDFHLADADFAARIMLLECEVTFLERLRKVEVFV